MNRIKEKLEISLGIIGRLLYYFLLLVISVLPLIVLKKSMIFDIVVIGLTQLFPPLDIVIWIWALVVVLMSPITALSIVFIVLFAVVNIPLIIGIIEAFV